MIDIKNIGFRDMRTPAELAIGAAPPLSRVAAPPSPKPGGPGALGAVSSLAGGAAKMTSGGFSAAKFAIQSRESSVSFSETLTTAARNFEISGSELTSGRTSIQDVALRSTDTFTSGSLTQFSGMRAGPISVGGALNFTKRLAYRQSRIAAMAGQFASIASAAVAVGVIINENRNRTPYPLEEDIDRPSLPRLAVGGLAAQLDIALRDKRRLLISGVSVGSGAPSFWNRILTSKLNPLKSYLTLPSYHRGLNMLFADKRGGASAGGSWSEPEPPMAGQYPFNNVRQTESGHIEEWDDTPGAERVHIFHRSGSFVEMHPDGKVVYKSMSHGYQISMGDYNVKVKGDCNFSVDGNATIHSAGEVHVQGDEGVNVETKKDFNVYAQNINLRARNRAKLDGKLVDLRYAKLPGVPLPVFGGLAVRFMPAEYGRDYPLAAKITADQQQASKQQVSQDIDGNSFKSHRRALRVLAGLEPAKGVTLVPPTDYAKELPEFDPLNPTKLSKPRDNPLGNPLIYHVTTQAAIDYRELLFDTPEEVEDAVQYQAHVDTRKALKDIPETAGPALGGNRTTPTSVHTVPENLPLVDYLRRADYYGEFVSTPPRPVPKSIALGGTSFTVGMLADSYSQPDVTIFVDKEEPLIDELSGYTGLGSVVGGGGGGASHGKPDWSIPNELATVRDVASRPSPRDGQPWNFADESSSGQHGSGAFTNAVVEALGPEWGHVGKSGAQKQYNGHAIDAIAYKSPTPLYNGKYMQVVDIIGSSGSSSGTPQWHLEESPTNLPDGTNAAWWRP